jgi:hypothetical protein
MRSRRWRVTGHSFPTPISDGPPPSPPRQAKKAKAQIEAFDRFCATCLILPLTDDIVVLAAEVYATLKERGAPIGDADILIGASTLAHGFAVVTNNESHFGRISGLQVVNWLAKTDRRSLTRSTATAPNPGHASGPGRPGGKVAAPVTGRAKDFWPRKACRPSRPGSPLAGAQLARPKAPLRRRHSLGWFSDQLRPADLLQPEVSFFCWN